MSSSFAPHLPDAVLVPAANSRCRDSDGMTMVDVSGLRYGVDTRTLDRLYATRLRRARL